eukprot:TRINITY_DN6389_c0_g1_i1.p1 TRINITY_DN6389_c0_g1~~TRINITY_DN6389_c0_g1_i1.p1  ORF type:complete len:594 (+),score=114.02 TRINITY_DN6389_c0_g1_i1:117-1898(+)
MAQWHHTTLQDLRARGVQYDNPRSALLHLVAEVAAVSELFQWKPEGFDPHQWPASDRRCLQRELGDVVLAAVRLADSCHIDLGEAAVSRLAGHPARAPAPAAGGFCQHADAAPYYPPAPPPAAAPPLAVPRMAVTPPPAPAAEAAPSSGGAASSPGGAAGTFNRPAFKRTLSVALPKAKADPAVVAKQFSPTHFDHGLFAPYTAKVEYEIDYGGPAGGHPPLPRSISKQRLQEDGPSGSPQRERVAAPAPATARDRLHAESNSSLATHSTVWSNQPSPPLSPLSPGSLKTNFFPMVEALQKTDFTEKEFMDLRLTWCIPIGAVEDLPGTRHYPPGQRFIDLKPNGRHTPVLLSARAEFVRLALDAQKRLRDGHRVSENDASPSIGAGGRRSPPAAAGTSLAPPAAAARAAATGPGGAARSKPSRPKFSRTLSVNLPKQEWDPKKVSSHFSPTHFDHGLFSPHVDQTDFVVPYGAGAKKVLPQSLSKKNLRVDTASPSSPESGSEIMLLSPKTRELEENFDPIVLELERLHASGQLTAKDFRDMGITFCIPHQGKIHDLIMNGRHIEVPLERLNEFLVLAKEKRRQLDRQAAAG